MLDGLIIIGVISVMIGVIVGWLARRRYKKNMQYGIRIGFAGGVYAFTGFFIVTILVSSFAPIERVLVGEQKLRLTPVETGNPLTQMPYSNKTFYILRYPDGRTADVSVSQIDINNAIENVGTKVLYANDANDENVSIKEYTASRGVWYSIFLPAWKEYEIYIPSGSVLERYRVSIHKISYEISKE